MLTTKAVYSARKRDSQNSNRPSLFLSKRSGALLFCFCLAYLLQAQFYVGYGLAWFPTGMNSIKTDHQLFNESSVIEGVAGPLTKEGNYLPIHHGFNIQWSSRFKNAKRSAFQISFNNYRNQAESIRKHSNGIVQKHHAKSRLNTLLFGLRRKPSSAYLKWMHSWTLQGIFSAHTYFITKGIFNENSDKWKEKSKEYDFGLDIGMNIELGSSLMAHIHYSRAMFLFSNVNPSYLGLNLYLRLGKK